MSETAIAGDGGEVRRVRLRKHWGRRLANEIAALLLALLLLLALGLVALDTAPGHRWLVDRIANLEIRSGLKIEIGRIDGSVFGKSRLRNVRISDSRGPFLTSPEIVLDWAPGAWLGNRLHIDSLTSERVTLSRLPSLKPSGRKGPLLPGFDIHVGRLDIRRLELGAGVSGTPRVGALTGSADIRGGRALVRFDGGLKGGDRFRLTLDSEPDRDRFDLDAAIRAPADGLLPAILGKRLPLELEIAGDGSWSRWRGRALLDLGGKRRAALSLAADSGRYALAGRIAPQDFLKGRLLRLTSPSIAVRGSATLRDRLLDGELRLTSPALRVVGRGALDLGRNRYRSLRIGADLLRPADLFRNMSGRGIRLVATLDGGFGRADFAYRLSAPLVKFDNVGFVDVRAVGRGRGSPGPLRVPLRLQARAVTGVGDVAGAILGNVRIEGVLLATRDLIRGDRLKLSSDKLSGDVSLLINLRNGDFTFLIAGGLARYAIPGLGIVDVKSNLRVVPGPGGKARVVGKAEAWVRRLDNSFFRELTGGLPRLTTDLERLPDGTLRFTNLQLYSPRLRLSGAGIRRRDGTFHIEARGRQAKYGTLRMVLDGRIERPRVDLLLDRPNDAMDLRAMRLLLEPIGEGFAYRASGSSRLGPFTSTGRILLPRGGRAVIAIAALDVAGTTARGDLRSDPGGFTGLLRLAGGGLDGTLGFRPVDGAQAIEAHLTASGANIPGARALAVRSGKLDGTIILAEGRTTLDGTIAARGLSYGAIDLARLTASGRLVNGSGQVRAAAAGRSGRAFELVGLADVTPDRISVTGRGQIDRRALTLESPMVLTTSGDGWQLAPTRVRFGGGRATVSGRTGSSPEIAAQLQAMPLQVLDIGWPGLGLAGIASGRLDYRWNGAGGRPSGRADLRVRGLSRSGLVLSSKPIDLGLAAVLDGGKAAFRSVAVSDGRTLGRAQGRFAPLGNGPVLAELINAPMLVQLRYAGPADTLWRLSGVEVFDLSGPVAVGADISGRLVDPRIRGSLKSDSARIESAVTGMVLQNVATSGRFGGSRLILDRIAGRTPGGGTVSGSGAVDFSGGSPAFDLDFNVARAELLARDDLAATVSGPIRIRSGGRGGTIAGQLRLDRGRFTLGQATGASGVPQLKVRHVGRDPDEVIEVAELTPWTLDLKVDGELTVRGLGIDSRWNADVGIGGNVGAPRLTGRADLVRGNYEFAGRGFRLDRGVIRFRGESPPDPLLDIRAEARVQGLDAAVLVRGTGLKPEISFSSVPQLPQDELLSRILFGTSITNLSAPEAVQLAAAVASLRSGSGGLDPINAVRRAVGLDRLRIVPADVSTGQGTAISAGKYIGRKLYVEVITDGQGYSATRIEYQVTRWLSLLSSISTVGRTSANVRVSRDY
ncbi:translocation/assembly module TamB domain-containing protein [Sphingomonas mesophila]|uniref:translocation/assembly module TamB domain-containing protein n=1 Tax=Sphingomonas mesophila TaxID=2303576 RepID=UPI001F07A3E5|nr:translocation/assembly module TamB domain-containing protein [Sphingomonas mesophila]